MRIGFVNELQGLKAVRERDSLTTLKDGGQIAVYGKTSHLSAVPITMGIMNTPSRLQSLAIAFLNEWRKERMSAIDTCIKQANYRRTRRRHADALKKFIA